MAHDVFISYAEEDKRVADRVCRALEQEGIRCWIAWRDANFAEGFAESIVDAIAASPFLVLIFSARSNASLHVRLEIEQAFKEGSQTKVFPFLLEKISYNKTLSYYLYGAEWVDATKKPLKARIEALVRHVRNRLYGGTSGTTGGSGGGAG